MLRRVRLPLHRGPVPEPLARGGEGWRDGRDGGEGDGDMGAWCVLLAPGVLGSSCLCSCSACAPVCRFVCMAERLLGRRIPFGFLQAVQDHSNTHDTSISFIPTRTALLRATAPSRWRAPSPTACRATSGSSCAASWSATTPRRWTACNP